MSNQGTPGSTPSPDDNDAAHISRYEEQQHGRAYIPINDIHLHNIGVEKGDKLGLELFNHNGRLGFRLTPDTERTSVVEPIKYDDLREVHTFLLPDELTDATRAEGAPVSVASDSEQITAIADIPHAIDGNIDIRDVMKRPFRLRGRSYRIYVPEEVIDTAGIVDATWSVIDTLESHVAMVMYGNEDTAPDGAVKRSVINEPLAGGPYGMTISKRLLNALNAFDSEVFVGQADGKVVVLVPTPADDPTEPPTTA